MKKIRGSCLCLFSLLTAFMAFSETKKLITAQEIKARTQSAVQSIKTGKTLKQKLKELENFYNWVDLEQEKIQPKPETPSYDRHLELSMLHQFVGLIPRSPFQKKKCADIKDSIVMGFSPRNEYPTAEEAPTAALTALKILGILCDDPRLETLPKDPQSN